MTPRRTCVAFAVTLALVMVASPGYAQIEANLGGLTAANTEKYLEPFPAAFSAALNTAVFKSGNVPKVGLNWSVGVVAMAVAYDEDMTTYRPSYPSGFSPTDPNSVQVPTVTGSEQAVAVDGQGGTQLYFPGGFDVENFAFAAPQLTIGSFMGTRAVIRYIALDLGDVEIGDIELIGFGAQHSISQYFVALPVDIAAGFFYQSFELGSILNSNALHLNVTGSRSFGIAEPYMGLGFDSYSMDVSYRNEVDDTDIKVEFDGESNLHFTLGVGVSLAIARLNAEFNQGATTGLAVGVGIGM